MELIMKNMMEPLVIEKIDEKIKEFDCCQCEQCKMDIATLALNHLPPKYVATRMGEFYSRLEAFSFQYVADVITAITLAAKQVTATPRHTDPNAYSDKSEN